MQKYNQNDIADMIRDAGLKYTEHRLSILTRIAKSKHPIAAHKLIEDIKKKYDIDQATVYRNLIALEESGLVKKFVHNTTGVSNVHAHYELYNEEIYNKVMCSNCETIEKVSGLNTEEMLKKIVKKSKNFKTSSVLTFEIYGLCKSCA